MFFKLSNNDRYDQRVENSQLTINYLSEIDHFIRGLF